MLFKSVTLRPPFPTALPPVPQLPLQWEHFCHGKQGILPQASPVNDILSQQMTWSHLWLERNTVYFRGEKEEALKDLQTWPRCNIMRTNRALLKKRKVTCHSCYSALLSGFIDGSLKDSHPPSAWEGFYKADNRGKKEKTSCTISSKLHMFDCLLSYILFYFFP